MDERLDWRIELAGSYEEIVALARIARSLDLGWSIGAGHRIATFHPEAILTLTDNGHTPAALAAALEQFNASAADSRISFD